MGTAQCDTGQQVAISPACFICLESDPPPVRSGCACRSDSGRAHLACLIKYAVMKHAERGIRPWVSCQICKHAFTGPTRLALGEAWWSRVCLEAEEHSERLLAAQNLSSCCLDAARYADAENLSRELHIVTRRVLGVYHRQTMVPITWRVHSRSKESSRMRCNSTANGTRCGGDYWERITQTLFRARGF
jgi:hypothetical protein